MFKPIDGVKVVGLVGQPRHGKDTFAQAMIRAVPGAERIAFSDLIAAHERISGRMTIRDPKHLQATHFTLSRHNLLTAMYEFINDRRPPLVVITGVRKPDEVSLIKSMGGELARIVRTVPGGGEFVTTDRDPNHPVERDIASLETDAMFVAPDVATLEAIATQFAKLATVSL